MNSYINFKTNSKQLQFGVNKCKKMYVGYTIETFKFQNLEVDKCSKIEIVTEETGKSEMKDIFEGEYITEESIK